MAAMSRLLIALLLVAGCKAGEDQPGTNQSVAEAATADGLTGLYEGGAARPPNQLCIVEGSGEATFGLVVWGSNQHSCSGSGTAVRSGATLRLEMAGDEACAIEATISGDTVTLPATIAEGCAYYCGARASLGAATFARKGNTPADAAQARDLVGDPLCATG